MADLSKRWLQPCQVVRISPCTYGEVKTGTDYMDNLWTRIPAQTLVKKHEKIWANQKSSDDGGKWRLLEHFRFQVFSGMYETANIWCTPLGSMTSLMHGMSSVQAGVYSGYPCQYKDWGFFQVCCFCLDGHSTSFNQSHLVKPDSRHWVRGCIPACSA